MPIVAEIDGPIGRFDKWLLGLYIQVAARNKQKTFAIMIDSPGGSPYAMRSIIDMLRASKMEIVTICTGMAASAAGPIFAEGKKRIAYPSARFMIHETRRMTFSDQIEKGSELSNESKEMDLLTDDMYKQLDSQTGKQSGYYKNLVYQNGNNDLWLSADEARRHNLVTDIKVPAMSDVFGSPTVQTAGDEPPLDLLMSANNLPENQTFNFESFQALKEERKQFILAKKMEFESGKAESVLTQEFEEFFFKNNYLLKTEEHPQMAKTVGNVDTDGAGQGNNGPGGTSDTPPPANGPITQETLNQALKSQADTLTQTFQEQIKQAKLEGRKEAETEMKTQIDDLSKQVGQVSAFAATAKADKEKAEAEFFLRELHSTENKITFKEISKELDYMLKYTRTEDGSRQAYMENLSNRPVITQMAKEGIFPDKAEGSFSEKHQRMVHDGASPEQVRFVAAMDEFLEGKERNDKNLRDARRFALNKFPQFAAKGANIG